MDTAKPPWAYADPRAASAKLRALQEDEDARRLFEEYVKTAAVAAWVWVYAQRVKRGELARHAAHVKTWRERHPETAKEKSKQSYQKH